MGRWSDSCFDPRTGAQLREYDRRSDALNGAKMDPFEVRTMVPYRCDKCGKWHCSPAQDSGPVPTDTTCLMCRGRDGQPKIAHPSFEHARAAAAKSMAELTVYVCPHGRGWHLTKG